MRDWRSGTMIEAAFARKFVEQITQYTEYNINIMNENGIIIASRDPRRIGTFHEVAYRIVTGSEEFVVTTKEGDYPGVLPGINQVIMLDGKREGVVGITGNPEEVRPIALITKMAVEAMLKFERQEEKLRLRFSRKDRFFNLLTQVEHADVQELRTIASDLQYSEKLCRVPILCKVRGAGAASVLSLVKANRLHTSEDISFMVDDSHLLVFKTIGPDSFSDGGKGEIEAYLKEPLARIGDARLDCTFFVGSFQRAFSQYYYGYRHCKWLEEQTRRREKIVYFYDRLPSYIASIMPQSELQRIFNVYEKQLDEKFLQEFSEVAEGLIAANYNLVTAAQKLNVHKNTLIYRLKKIRDALGLNVLESAGNRFFMEAFYWYLLRRE